MEIISVRTDAAGNPWPPRPDVIAGPPEIAAALAADELDRTARSVAHWLLPPARPPADAAAQRLAAVRGVPAWLIGSPQAVGSRSTPGRLP